MRPFLDYEYGAGRPCEAGVVASRSADEFGFVLPSRNIVLQPSLSQQVHKLENELRTKLFDRLGTRVRLTSFAETFLPRAETPKRDLTLNPSRIALIFSYLQRLP